MKPKVILVDIIDPKTTPEESLARLNELESLLVTYGGFVIIRKIQKRQSPDYQTYIGKGKVDEILEEAKSTKATYVIINNLLKPQQSYNLEKIFETHNIQIWDKIDLILNIFAKHATTKEAKLQIELASLRHLGPRIFKMGDELMRQAGGIGTRGKGETNIEIMKRHIARRKQKVKDVLKKIEKNQSSQRRHRKNSGFKIAAIVGYTNAGKSSLLRALTGKKVKVQNELFATLDSRIGKVYLPKVQGSVLMSDTIGFIRNLPPELIHAFHSTLAETIHADLLIHVIDASDLEMEWKIETVDNVLEGLECECKNVVYIFNKIDLVMKDRLESLKEDYSALNPIFLSAERGINLNELKDRIGDELLLNGN